MGLPPHSRHMTLSVRRPQLTENYAAYQRLPRHTHQIAYAAVVVDGSYTEAGDRGRFVVRPGYVAFHSAFEAHTNLICCRGARILNLPIAGSGASLGAIDDVDELVKIAERDVEEAGQRLRQSLTDCDIPLMDWPDLLAADLIGKSDINLTEWAAAHSLSLQSISRGFKRVFGVSPKEFRARQRALRAIAALPDWSGKLAALSAELGYFDQSHMCRSIRQLTGRHPKFFAVK